MKIIRYLLSFITITIITGLPVSAVSYDQKIIEYLNEALTKPNNYANKSYTPLFQYLQSQQKNGPFQAHLRSGRLKMNLSEAQEDSIVIGHLQICQGKQRFTKLPLYPFRSDRIATVASFDNLEDSRFLALPPSLKEYYQTLFNETQSEMQQENATGGEVVKSLPPEKLAELAPEFNKGRFWLVSAQRGILGELDSLNFTTWVECGQLQIDLRFRNQLNNALFAFYSEEGKLPHLLYPQISPRQMPPGLMRRGIVAVPIAPRSTIVYIASTDNTYGQFNLLWDWRSKRILYFDMALGYSLGNETEHLTRNYLLEYKNHFYLLRGTDNQAYSELVYFGNKYVERDSLADYRAMEL